MCNNHIQIIPLLFWARWRAEQILVSITGEHSSGDSLVSPHMPTLGWSAASISPFPLLTSLSCQQVLYAGFCKNVNFYTVLTLCQILYLLKKKMHSLHHH